MDLAYIGFGSNCGDREHYILSALHMLMSSPSSQVRRISSLYESKPVEGVGGSLFLNGVVKMSTSLEPEDLLIYLQTVESSLGRDMDRRSGPRTIDLDILLYGDRVVQTPTLTIPHPKMARRSFVLLPLIEIEPDVVHPLEGRKISDLVPRLEEPAAIRLYGSVPLQRSKKESSL